MDTAAVTALASWLRSHDGVIGLEEARRLGVSARALRQQVTAGRLHHPARGVFVDAAAARNPRTALRIAMFLAGEGTVVSHRSAAWLWDLVDQPPGRPTITVTATRSVRVPGVIVHRTDRLPPQRRHAGFLVTEPDRTIVDVAARGTDALIDSLVDRALSRGLVTVAALDHATQPGGHRRGVGSLRRRLSARGHLAVPEPSVLESRMGRILRRLAREAGLPDAKPEVAWLDGRYRLDYAWPAVRLAVEVDGFTWHGSVTQMRRDYERRNRLTMVGWIFLIYTWPQVTDEADRVMAEIADTYRLLSHAGVGRWA